MRHLDEGELQDWLDQERSGVGSLEADEIGRHLELCPECAERLARLEDVTRRARSVLSSVEPADQSVPDFAAIVARTGSTGRRPRRHRWIAAAWAASLVGAIAVGWLANDRLGEPRIALAPEREERAGAASAATPEAETTRPEAEARSDAPDARGGDTGDTRVTTAPEPTRVAVESAPGDSAPVAPDGQAAPPADERVAAAARAPEGLGPSPNAEASEQAGDVSANESAPGEGPVVVTGRVTDEAGTPLSAVQVYASGTDVGVLTDDDGNYALALPEGADSTASGVKLTAQRIGFRTATRAIVPGGGDTATADFRLGEQALALEEVVVTGVPGAVPGAPQRRAVGYAVGPTAPETTWTSVDPARAGEEAGFPVLFVPGLEVLGVEMGRLEGAAAVRVRQAIDPETVLTVIQRRYPIRSDAAADRDRPEVAPRVGRPNTDPGRPSESHSTVYVRRGNLWLTASASVSPDSLRALLDRVR